MSIKIIFKKTLAFFSPETSTCSLYAIYILHIYRHPKDKLVGCLAEGKKQKKVKCFNG